MPIDVTWNQNTAPVNRSAVITVEEIADFVGVSTDVVYRWKSEGKLLGVPHGQMRPDRKGGRPKLVFDRDAILQWMQDNNIAKREAAMLTPHELRERGLNLTCARLRTLRLKAWSNGRQFRRQRVGPNRWAYNLEDVEFELADYNPRDGLRYLDKDSDESGNVAP